VKPWWRDVVRVTLEHFDDRGTAEGAERRAIRKESPLYNVRDMPKPGARTTRRFSISIPEDVAERLDREDNASAYIAGAVRDMIRREQVLGILTAAGITIESEDVEQMRRRIHDLEQRRSARLAAAGPTTLESEIANALSRARLSRGVDR
jgi:hypothetical protein